MPSASVYTSYSVILKLYSPKRLVELAFPPSYECGRFEYESMFVLHAFASCRSAPAPKIGPTL